MTKRITQLASIALLALFALTAHAGNQTQPTGVRSVSCSSGVACSTSSGAVTETADLTVVQARIVACGAGSAIEAVDGAGNPTCIATGGLSGGTTNGTPVWTSPTSLGVGTTSDNLTTFKVGNFAGTTVTDASTGTANDVAIGTATMLRLPGGVTYNGFAGGVDGRVVILYADTSVSSSTLANQAAGDTTAANRIITTLSANTTIPSEGGAWVIVYDGTQSRWVVVAEWTNYFSQAYTFASTLSAAGITSTSGGVTSFTGSSTGANGITMTHNPSAATASENTINGIATGTFNTTSGALSHNAIQGAVTSTRSTGTNNLTNIGGAFSASGAQLNYAIRTTAGDANLAAGHLTDTGQTAPALSGCGTLPTITGSDLLGTVVEGAGATGCTLTFAVSYNGNGTTTDSCAVTPHAVQATFSYTEAAATLTITNTSPETFTYICGGH